MKKTLEATKDFSQERRLSAGEVPVSHIKGKILRGIMDISAELARTDSRGFRAEGERAARRDTQSLNLINFACHKEAETARCDTR